MPDQHLVKLNMKKKKILKAAKCKLGLHDWC